MRMTHSARLKFGAMVCLFTFGVAGCGDSSDTKQPSVQGVNTNLKPKIGRGGPAGGAPAKPPSKASDT